MVNAITTPSCQHKATFITDYYLKVLWRLLKAWNSFPYLKQKGLIKFPDPSANEQNKATSISHTSWNKLVGVSRQSRTLWHLLCPQHIFIIKCKNNEKPQVKKAKQHSRHSLKKRRSQKQIFSSRAEPNKTDTKLWPQSMLNLTNLVLTSEPTTAMCKDSRKQRR